MNLTPPRWSAWQYSLAAAGLLFKFISFGLLLLCEELMIPELLFCCCFFAAVVDLVISTVSLLKFCVGKFDFVVLAVAGEVTVSYCPCTRGETETASRRAGDVVNMLGRSSWVIDDMVLLLLLFWFLPNNVVDDQKFDSQLLDLVPDFFVDASACISSTA
jgi:membrane protein implicated in regulation of membrane protease activity